MSLNKTFIPTYVGKHKILTISSCSAEVRATAIDITLDEYEKLKFCNASTQAQKESVAKFGLSLLYHVPLGEIDKDFVLRYDDDRANTQYTNRCSLRRYGENAPLSIRRMEVVQREEADASFMTSMGRLVGKVDECSLENIRQRAWHEVSKEGFRMHQSIQDLFELTTAFPGLHVVDDQADVSITISSIREHLGYPEPVKGPRGGVKRGGKTGEASSQVVERMCKIHEDLCKYVPGYHGEPIQVKGLAQRCTSTLNTVLSSTYGYSFEREKDEDGKPTNNYILGKSKLFGGDAKVKDIRWDEDRLAAKEDEIK